MVGTMLLAEFVALHGLGWVRDMRSLLRALDWSAYQARYKPGGRQPYHPAAMVGLILLGHMTGRTSLRQMEGLARTDIRAWWLTGGLMPDFTSLCRFVNRHAEDLSGATFEELTRKILRILGSKADSVFVDGTVVQAAASRWQLVKQEAARQAAEEARSAAEANSDDKALAQRAKLAETVHEMVQARDQARQAKGREASAQIAPHEPEAMVQPLKDGGYAPSYKPSAAANADRIIVGKQVEAANECRQVDSLLDQAERVAGEAVKTVACDAGYNSADVLEMAERRGVELLCPEGKTTRGGGSWTADRSKLGKDKFRFDPARDLYVCPYGRELTRGGSCKPKGGKPAYVKYKSRDCSNCPLADLCLMKASARTIKRFAHEAKKDALRARMEDPDARRRYKKRQASIEPVHGEQKNVQGMRRFRRKGLAKVRLEYSLHCMAHNLRRFGAIRLSRARRRTGASARTKERVAPCRTLAKLTPASGHAKMAARLWLS